MSNKSQLQKLKNLNFKNVLSHNAVPNRSIKNKNKEVLGPPK